MTDSSVDLDVFMAAYERATNTHDISQVTPLIWDDATYWFF